MGLITPTLQLSNAKRRGQHAVNVDALVDTGALHLCIPEHIAIQLRLDEVEKREVTTADGKRHLVPYAGPVIIQFKGRNCITGALVLGDGVLLGAIPMEDMDLVINPATQCITANPASPNIPTSVAKGLIRYPAMASKPNTACIS